MRWRLTASGKLVLALALMLYLASLTSQSSLLLLLDGILLGTLAVNAGGAWRSARDVVITIPRRVRFVEGQPALQPWTLRNPSPHWIGLISVGSVDSAWVRAGTLPPGAELHVAPEAKWLRRGTIALTELHLAARWPFGLLLFERPMKAEGEILVVPAVYPVHCPPAAGFDIMIGGKFRGRRRTRAGSDFSGTRPFEAGDPIRQIHWKASAKGLGIMAKTFEEEVSGRVAILTDGGFGVEPRIRDDSLRAAGSLMFAALDAGHHVEWQDLASSELVLFPPFIDGEVVLDRLARIESSSVLPSVEQIRIAIERFSRRGRLSIVLTRLNPVWVEIVRSLNAAGRSGNVYIPDTMGSADLSDVASIHRFDHSSISHSLTTGFGFIPRIQKRCSIFIF